MAVIEILLPKMGESVAEATITNLLVEPGPSVEADEAIVEIATDKVDSEVPAPEDGVLVEWLIAVGDVVPVGAPIAKYEVGGEAGESAPATAPAAAPAPIASPEPADPAPATPAPAPVMESSDSSEIQPKLIGVVVKHTGYPEDFIEMDQESYYFYPNCEIGHTPIKAGPLYTTMTNHRYQ